MKIGEYINEKLILWSVDLKADYVRAELLKAGLDYDAEVSGDTNTDQFFYNIIPDILLLPRNITEGGYSISYDKDSLVKFYSMVANRLGLENTLSDRSVRNKSNIW